MIKFLKEYFNYSVKELGPLYFIIILLFISIIIRSSLSSPDSFDYMVNHEILRKNQDFISKLRIAEKHSKKEFESKETQEPDLFFFDPNTIDKDQLSKLGLDNRIASNLLKYRKAGGKFVVPSDLKVLYGLSEDLFEKLEPWIEIKSADTNIEIKAQTMDNLNDKPLAIESDLNSILYKDLIKLTGGNPKITGRILNFRQLLGGYYSMKQLWNVYEMNDSLYESLNSALTVDTLKIQSLSLNNSEYSDFLRHPYLNKTQVNLIMKYRQYKNSKIRMNEFIENMILPDSTLKKILPYLKE
ncbi:MAG: helix-hairpin-helix domain-containing protein [Bacteroidales bacterium]|nr:helix-hairpin-helix domain-containing protein [Bacteroidales bacterium]MCF8390587.1 helix-hairpin-helix domain-containing protein [Bacteroidales bacterium]